MAASDHPPRAVDPEALARLADEFPSLAYTLGPRRFARVGAEALAQGQELGQPAGASVERVVVHRLMRLGARRIGATPSRLAADLAALEWAHASVVAQPRPRALPLRRDELPDGADLDRSVLLPLAALRIVPVAFALQAFVRRVRENRRPAPPARADHTLVVARPHFEPFIETLTRGEGRLLSLTALGAPVGDAVATAAAQAWTTDVASARAALRTWVGMGLFAERRPLHD